MTDSTEGMHTPLLKRIAKLQGEVAYQRQIIWLLIRQQGGTAGITDAEVAACPQLPGLTLSRADDGIILTADGGPST